MTIGTFCDISPGTTITGAAVIEDSVFIGAGSVLINGLKIGQGASVAAGSLIFLMRLMPVLVEKLRLKLVGA